MAELGSKFTLRFSAALQNSGGSAGQDDMVALSVHSGDPVITGSSEELSFAEGSQEPMTSNFV